MTRIFALITLLLLIPLSASAALIQSGPMLGYASMAEAMILVQTDAPATVHIEYWPADDVSSVRKTDPVRTEKHSAFIAKCIADQVVAGTSYGYAVYVDGEKQAVEFRPAYREGPIPMVFHTPPNWRFRESGHEPFDFTVGFGSCAYINEEGGYDRLNGRPYGAGYEIFESIYEVDPDVFIWLGDNIYYREPDWSSRTGMIHRWTHDRSIPELRGMLANIPNYGIWDDHDYGPNDIGRYFWHKEVATEVFSLFHGNPTAGLPETPGIFSYFAWGDVHFYLTDNRTYRTVADLDPEPYGYHDQMFGKEQIDWLIELMKWNRNQSISSYPCTFHVIAVGNQIIAPTGKDSLRDFPQEWEYLFNRLADEELHNVIFISGDVHRSEVNTLTFKDVQFWDITSSPLCAGPSSIITDPNPYRVDIFQTESNQVNIRNFATLSFEGPLIDRRAVIRFYDTDGNLLNQHPDKEPGVPTDASVIQSQHLNLSKSLYE